MANPSHARDIDDPYGQLLRRLTLALDDADRIACLSDRPSSDLEVRGLTPAELALIQAYMAKDRSWMNGLGSELSAAIGHAAPPFERKPALCNRCETPQSAEDCPVCEAQAQAQDVD